jgi:leucyl/phenylalanyl-tRNA--protein transferase
VSGLAQLARLGDDPDAPFPPVAQALPSPNGLLAWGGDLRPQRLLRAYRNGIFPWYLEGQPILWWSPAPRCVIYPDKVHISRRTRRRYNAGQYELTADTAFGDVVAGCAEPRSDTDETWITPAMAEAYGRLHDMGHAHSVEVWQGPRLQGGIYGVAIGAVFFGESMFSRAPDASKIALIALCCQLDAWGYRLLDCQVGNAHLYSMGAEDLARERFESELERLIAEPQPAGSWSDRARFETRW